MAARSIAKKNRDKYNSRRRDQRNVLSLTPAQNAQRLAYQRQWRSDHREHVRKRDLAYRTRRRDHLYAMAKKWRDRNAAHLSRLRAEKWRKTPKWKRQEMYRRAASNPKTKAKRLASVREWCKRNPEKKRALDRRWYEANKARVFACTEARRRAHPEQARARCALRYARKKKATVGDTKKIREFYKRVQIQNYVECRYCKREAIRGRDRHVDHVVPLSRGGSHCVKNLVAACGKCNRDKKAKLLREWPPKSRWYNKKRVTG